MFEYTIFLVLQQLFTYNFHVCCCTEQKTYTLFENTYVCNYVSVHGCDVAVSFPARLYLVQLRLDLKPQSFFFFISDSIESLNVVWNPRRDFIYTAQMPGVHRTCSQNKHNLFEAT